MKLMSGNEVGPPPYQCNPRSQCRSGFYFLNFFPASKVTYSIYLKLSSHNNKSNAIIDIIVIYCSTNGSSKMALASPTAMATSKTATVWGESATVAVNRINKNPKDSHQNAVSAFIKAFLLLTLLSDFVQKTKKGE